MKKVLIIGARGNLGIQVRKFFNNDYDIIPFDKEELDITNRELVIGEVVKINPSIIINCAAYNNVDACEDDAGQLELAKKINGLAPGYLAEAALKIEAVFIHYSSDYIFSGSSSKKSFQEDSVPGPINEYGKTKLLGEKEILKYKDSRLNFYIIRLSKLFGPGGESDVAKPSFFDIMLDLSKEKQELDIVDEELSCFTYSLDLAEWTKKLLESEKEFGIYHFVNEGVCTWCEAARELFKIAEVNIKVNPVKSDKFPRPARRPRYSALDNTKFEKMRPWQESLKEYLMK